MAVDVPRQAFVFKPCREVRLRAAELEVQNPGLCQIDLRRGCGGTLLLAIALCEENDVFASETLVDLFGN